MKISKKVTNLITPAYLCHYKPFIIFILRKSDEMKTISTIYIVLRIIQKVNIERASQGVIGQEEVKS
jgi:hypothetical protein